MDTKWENKKEESPPLYEETVRNRKKSTISIISQQIPRLIEDLNNTIHEQKIVTRKSKNDTENQKVLIEDTKEPPKDRLFFVLISVTLLGLVHQLPHSYFGMANEYWMYKLRNTTFDSTDPNNRTYLQVNFSALSGIITIIPTVICNFLLTFFAHNIEAKTRVMVTLVLHSIIFVVEVILVNINTDSWQEQFFILTAATMVFVMCSISFGAAGQYGLIPKLPPMYMKSFLLGGGISSLFNAVMRLLSVAISPSVVGSANIYFGTATLLILVTTIMTALATNTTFFRHYTINTEIKKAKVRTSSEIIDVLANIWPMILLNIFLLGVPSGSISNLVVSEHHDEKGNVWAHQYFITVCSYLIPSLTRTMGQAIYNKLDWIWSMPALFIVVIIYQLVGVITIYFANALPRHHLPVWFKHDWEYALAMGIHSFALGFIWNMTTMKSISMVPPEQTELAMLILYLTNSITQAAFSPLGMVVVNII